MACALKKINHHHFTTNFHNDEIHRERGRSMKKSKEVNEAGLIATVDSSEVKSFSYAKIWWIGFGFLGVQLVFTTYNAFLPLMYRDFFESRAIIGLLMGTDNLIGLLLIPIIGAWSDRVNSPLGRRLPFMIVAVPVAALTFFAIPLASAILWTLIITEILFTAAMHSYRGPVITLMPDHTPPEKRSTANGIINLMGGLGTLIAFGGLSLLYDIDPRLTFGIGSAVLLLTLLVVYKKVDRHPPYVDNTLVASKNPIKEAIDGIKVLLKPQNFGQFLILAAMLTYFIGFAGLDAMFPIYGVETLGLTEGRAGFYFNYFCRLISYFCPACRGDRHPDRQDTGHAFRVSHCTGHVFAGYPGS
jgi:maltose/moltooligosaccharide transporter